MALGTAAYWITRVRGRRLNRALFANSKPGRASNRTPRPLQRLILDTRRELREQSALGEYGLEAIQGALAQKVASEQIPGRTTIYEILERHGVFDAAHRRRRPPPPKGSIARLDSGQARPE